MRRAPTRPQGWSRSMTWSQSGERAPSLMPALPASAPPIAAPRRQRLSCRFSSSRLSPELREEVVALVVDDDEGGEVDDLDAPDRLHPELGIFDHLDTLDAV